MKFFKKFISVILSTVFCLSCLSVFGCSKKPKKTTMTAILENNVVEVGDMVELPIPTVIDKEGNDISNISEYFVMATDPQNNDAYIDESGALKKLEILLVGEYKVVYTLMEDETVTCELKLTAKDTTAPVVKNMLDYKLDLFLGETFRLPKPVPEDASGIDTSKTKLTVTANKDNSEVTLDDKKSFVVTDLEGYTLHVSLTDNNSISKTYDYPIRVTEKWLDSEHLNGREVVTFGNEKYLNNIKECDIRKMDYTITNDVPKANENDKIGSSDGEALKVTLPSGAKRERCWLRVWFPKPLERVFGSLKMKLWANEAVESIWWHNRELDGDDAIGAWSVGKNNIKNDIAANTWSIVEAQELKFSNEVYPEKVEYLDFAFWLKDNDVEPEIYIDEIFYDTIETSFVDTNVVDDFVLADFNEIGDSDYTGNPTKVGYEETIKVRGDVDRKLEYPLGTRRSIIDFVDKGSNELGGNGADTGDKALKVTPKLLIDGTMLDSNFFFMFPKKFEYNDNYFIEMDLFIPNLEYSILVRSYSEDKTFFEIKVGVDKEKEVPLKANEWNTVRIPMKNFAGDLETHGNGGMFLQFYDKSAASGKTEPMPAYIDNIVVSKYEVKLSETVIEDFTNENPGVSFKTKDGEVKGTYCNPEAAKAYDPLVTKGTGAYVMDFYNSSADGEVSIKFNKALKRGEFKEIRIYFYINSSFNFGLMNCFNEKGEPSDNCGDAENPNGYIWKKGERNYHVFSMPDCGKLAFGGEAFTEVSGLNFRIGYTEAKSAEEAGEQIVRTCVIDKITYVSNSSELVLRTIK